MKIITKDSLLRTFVLLALTLHIGACGQRVANQGSRPDSVGIPQTAVENQLSVGFCWAYAAVGLMESNHKLTTDRDINLSEESIGFYRMATAMHQLTQTKKPMELVALLMGSIEGAFVSESDEGIDALTLLNQHGVVPESIWSFKFTEKTAATKMKSSLQAALLKQVLKKIGNGESPREITFDEVVEKVMVARGAYLTAPPREFDFEGSHYTSTAFVTDYLKFDTGMWRQLYVNEPADFDKIVGATKRSLARGISVAFAFPINFARLDKGNFSGKDVDLNKGENFFKEGAHAVLITDFVNRGSDEGAISETALIAEVERPANDLDYHLHR